ncbi:MAG: hypothetical protein V3T86_15840 [Planctomycetota bacterium]
MRTRRCRTLPYLPILLALAACGAEEAPAPEPKDVAPVTEKTAPVDKFDSAAARAELKRLRALIAAYGQRATDAIQAERDVFAAHRTELEAASDYAADRRELRESSRQLRVAKKQVEHFEKKLGPLNPVYVAAQKQLEELHAKSDALDEQIDDMRAEFSRRLLNPQLHESPAAKALSAIREVQREWMTVTHEARAKKPSGTKKRKLNAAFRAWVSEDAVRTDVVGRALAAGLEKRKTDTARFDFTDLSFFVLCQIVENDLDKSNVAVERDLMAEQRAKESVLVAEADKLQIEISDLENSPAMIEMAEKQDIILRLDNLREKRSTAQGRVDDLEVRLKPDRAMRERHTEEEAVVAASVRETEKLLRATKEKFDALQAEIRHHEYE